MCKYTVTVIIPIYNMERCIEDAIDSLKEQRFSFEKMEVIIIDDGSTDDSIKICREICSRNSNIKLICNTHEGVSAARNTGIKRAQGKYIMFLDGDDLLDVETVKSVTDFFDAHYYEVDLVTYPLKSYKNHVNGARLKDHYRYEYLKDSKVYDLREYPYITQTTMNIVVKNRFSANILFREDMFFTEDQGYCFDNLKRFFKIGYCSKGAYLYIRHEKSSSSLIMNSATLFESCMAFWEKLFAEFENKEKIPRYVQAAYLNDLGWKNMSNILYPYHYRDEILFNQSVDRIVYLLSMVENETILQHPGLDEYHKYYYMNLKQQIITIVSSRKNILLCCDDQVLKKIQKVDMIIEKINFIDNKLIIRGFFQSVLFNFSKNHIFVEKIHKKDGSISESQIKAFIGAKSWHKSHTRTNSMWAFEQEMSQLDNIKKISYYVKIEDCILPVTYNFTYTSAFYERVERKKIIGDKYIAYFNKGFVIEKSPKVIIDDYKNSELDYYKTKHPDIAYIRKKAESLPDQEIWLYYDAKGIVKDNGFYQFAHDFIQRDGVLRYYVTQNDINQYDKNLYGDHIITFGAHEHQILFLRCVRILTAYIENYNIIPFSDEDFCRIADILRYKVIYLQHGILHAYVPWKYTYLGNLADQVVISSNFESKMFREVFCYPQSSLIYAGMPRYDKYYAKYNQTNQKKYILYAPSWRAYLAFLNQAGEWEALREKFYNSDFFREIKNIFCCNELQDFLEANDLKFVIKLHPIFNIYREELKKLQSNTIYLNDPDNDYGECCLFVTDFSSYVFDYVKKKIPVIYFFPDEKEFYSGLNGYYRLVQPLEKGFGPIVKAAADLVDYIEEYHSNNYQSDIIYENRTRKFFFNCDDACNTIYTEIRT